METLALHTARLATRPAAALVHNVVSPGASVSGRQQKVPAVLSSPSSSVFLRKSSFTGETLLASSSFPSARTVRPRTTPAQAALLDGLSNILPPELGGKKTAVITGTSSGLGLSTARVLIESGKWFVIMAVRDVDKMRRICEEEGYPKGSYSIMQVDLSSMESTARFANDLKALKKRIDVLCCNAAVYLPNQQKASFTEDGFETSVAVNHLSHFLLVRKMLPELKKVRGARCIIVGSITGNTNTVGGGAVLPFADLGDLEGFEAGFQNVPMMDGKEFNGAKAYKDSKLANMMTVLELHRRYHESTGITFSSMYPGCIAESALFRQKRGWFRWLFPIFMKYVTGGYVSEEEAGERLAQVVADPRCGKSGIYWSWNGGAKTVGFYDWKKGEVAGAGGAGGELFENTPSDAVRDPKMGKKLWELTEKVLEPYMAKELAQI